MDEPLDCLELTDVGGATVARFTREVVLSGRLAETFGDRLGAALAGQERPRLVVDFANVQSLTTMGLTKLVTLNRAAEAAGGRLALCNLRPVVRKVMEVTRLTLILRIYPGEREARESV
jgi:anti-sigma B factor antagonist